MAMSEVVVVVVVLVEVRACSDWYWQWTGKLQVTLGSAATGHAWAVSVHSGWHSLGRVGWQVGCGPARRVRFFF